MSLAVPDRGALDAVGPRHVDPLLQVRAKRKVPFKHAARPLAALGIAERFKIGVWLVSHGVTREGVFHALRVQPRALE